MRNVARQLLSSSCWIVGGFGGPMSGFAGVVLSKISFGHLDFTGSVWGQISVSVLLSGHTLAAAFSFTFSFLS